MLGAHPRDKRPVELHSGRYGPYVKHGSGNATVPDRDTVDALTFDDALALLAAKTGKPAPAATTRATKAVVRKSTRAPAKPAAKGPPPNPRRATAAKTAPARNDAHAKPAAKSRRPARQGPKRFAQGGASPMTATDTAPRDSTGHHYAALDGLRGVAVLLVFCVHAAGNAAAVALDVDFERMRFASLATMGERLLFWLYASHHGVFLFFVLSGFLIGRMWWPRPVMRYTTFAWRRTLRIYPAFLLAFAGSLVFAYTSGTWQPPKCGGSWPTCCSSTARRGRRSGVQHHHVVAVLRDDVLPRIPGIRAAGAGGGARAAWCLWAQGSRPVIAAQLGANALVLCWSLLFFGVAFALHERAVRALAHRMPTAVVVLAYLAVTTLSLVDVLPAVPAILCFGLAAVLVLAKSLEPGNAVSWVLTRKALRALGRISYSFYLVHWMLVVLVARAVAPHSEEPGPVAETLAIFGGFVVSAAVATALWWIAERPYFTRVRRSRR